MKLDYAARGLRLTGYRIKRELARASALLAFVGVGLYVYNQLKSVVRVCMANQFSATLAGFAFLTNGSVTQLVIMTGAIALFCHAPFRDELYPQLIVRSGKRGWTIANITSILVLSAMYVLFLLLVYVVSMLPVLELSTKWGQAWTLLSRSGSYILSISVSNLLTGTMRGQDAFLYALLLEYSCVAFIGLCIYAGNCLHAKPLGLYAGCAFLLMDIFVWNVMPNSWRAVSPISVAMLAFYRDNSGTLTWRNPTLLYGGGGAFCIGMIWLLENRFMRGREKNE